MKSFHSFLPQTPSESSSTSVTGCKRVVEHHYWIRTRRLFLKRPAPGIQYKRYFPLINLHETQQMSHLPIADFLRQASWILALLSAKSVQCSAGNTHRLQRTDRHWYAEWPTTQTDHVNLSYLQSIQPMRNFWRTTTSLWERAHSLFLFYLLGFEIYTPGFCVHLSATRPCTNEQRRDSMCQIRAL